MRQELGNLKDNLERDSRKKIRELKKNACRSILKATSQLKGQLGQWEKKIRGSWKTF